VIVTVPLSDPSIDTAALRSGVCPSESMMLSGAIATYLMPIGPVDVVCHVFRATPVTSMPVAI
jgi:hypothetical protein